MLRLCHFCAVLYYPIGLLVLPGGSLRFHSFHIFENLHLFNNWINSQFVSFTLVGPRTLEPYTSIFRVYFISAPSRKLLILANSPNPSVSATLHVYPISPTRTPTHLSLLLNPPTTRILPWLYKPYEMMFHLASSLAILLFLSLHLTNEIRSDTN